MISPPNRADKLVDDIEAKKRSVSSCMSAIISLPPHVEMSNCLGMLFSRAKQSEAEHLTREKTMLFAMQLWR